MSPGPGVGAGVVIGLGTAGTGRVVESVGAPVASAGTAEIGAGFGRPEIPTHTIATSAMATTTAPRRAEPPPRTRVISGSGSVIYVRVDPIPRLVARRTIASANTTSARPTPRWLIYVGPPSRVSIARPRSASPTDASGSG